MTSNIWRMVTIIVISVLVLSFLTLLLLPSSLAVGVMHGADGALLPGVELSTIPGPVLRAANTLRNELYRDGEASELFKNQLLRTYAKVRDAESVIIFNPGGWGWNTLEASPGWTSIIAGIKRDLGNLGYSTVVLSFERTKDDFKGYSEEIISFISLRPLKSKDLAARVRFLTEQLPNLKVVIAGESTGSMISDRVMRRLENNPRVYSIQTGPPFWYKNTALKKTLVLTSNGIIPDALSVGDVLSLTLANLKASLKALTSREGLSNMLRGVAVPGHEYKWEFPSVSSRIKQFLEQNFKRNFKA